MQTVIVKDKEGGILARVITCGYFEIKSVDDLISILMDKGGSVEPDRPLPNKESSPSD